jgi:hypothetical protein
MTFSNPRFEIDDTIIDLYLVSSLGSQRHNWSTYHRFLQVVCRTLSNP